MTTTLDEQGTNLRTPLGAVAASEAAPIGLAAALVVCGWLLAGERWADPYYFWASAAAVLGFVALLRPITRRGFVRRACLAPLQIVATILVLFSGDRALGMWEERAPLFAAASTIASGVLNLVGYHVAAERGHLLIDHPEGLVTVVPSIEKVALRPFLLFWLVWVALRLVRGHRQTVACALLGLAATLLALFGRYVAILAAYVEHDNILSDRAGQAALDLFASPWITCFSLLLAGLAADRACRLVPDGHAAGTPVRSKPRAIFASASAVTILGGAMGFASTYVPEGKEKPGRILVDDRYCGIWEPTARQLDTDWYGDFPTYSFTSLAEWLGKWYSVDANTTRAYDDELLSAYDVLIIKTPEEPIPDEERAAIQRFVPRGGGLLLAGEHPNLLGMGTHLNAISAKHGIRFRYDSVSDGLTGGFPQLHAAVDRPPSRRLARRELGIHDILLASTFRRSRDRAGGGELPSRAARLCRLQFLRTSRPPPRDGARPDRAGRDGTGRPWPHRRVYRQHSLVVVRHLQPRPGETRDGSRPVTEPGAEPVRSAYPVCRRRHRRDRHLDSHLDGALGHGDAGNSLQSVRILGRRRRRRASAPVDLCVA